MFIFIKERKTIDIEKRTNAGNLKGKNEIIFPRRNERIIKMK